MTKRTVYWLPKIGPLVLASGAFMACSAVLRIFWACGEDALSQEITEIVAGS